MLISYCTTCMGRFWQLRQTLPAHLSAFRGRKDVEFVVLDYNSRDGLEEWVREDRAARAAMASGLLTYVREREAVRFSAPHAKNVAHRLARGDILFNLDGDNWIDDADDAMRHAFNRADCVFHGYSPAVGGSFGRIGMTREWFFRLGGYDESFEPMAYQDQDLLDRAAAAGLQVVTRAPMREPIRNSMADKTAFTGRAMSWEQMFEANRRRSRATLASRQLRVNPGGWGAAVVSVNFGPFEALEPVLRSGMAAPPRNGCTVVQRGGRFVRARFARAAAGG